MKIYVITAGSYSDYHICAVSEDEQKAELLAKKFSSLGDDANIEEFDTEDNERILSYKCLYDCYEDLIFQQTPITVKECSFEFVTDKSFCVEEIRFGPYHKSHVVVNKLHVVVNADNEEQALKIAADKFAQYKAEHMGL